jgi:AcrR family transcriptional regulator
MARTDTRQRIQEVARELFRTHGVTQVSLQQIAAELGITKPALYYHFASREELVRSIIEPLLTGIDRYLDELGTVAESDPRAVLEGFFDFHLQHRELLELTADCVIVFAHVPDAELRVVAVDAACATLGIA